METTTVLFAALRLQAIFDVVLGLAVIEAFRQFVFDKPAAEESPAEKSIHWDRLLALLALVLLIVPFYQGIGEYMHAVYQVGEGKHPNPYGLFLLIDCGVFMLESSLFFVMSRRLPLVDWVPFYQAVLILLAVDSGWGAFLWLTHYREVVTWLVLNLCSIPVFLALWFCGHKSWLGKSGAVIGCSAVAVRTVVDYWTSWSFYFPP
jgi:hypothetical protein